MQEKIVLKMINNKRGYQSIKVQHIFQNKKKKDKKKKENKK